MSILYQDPFLLLKAKEIFTHQVDSQVTPQSPIETEEFSSEFKPNNDLIKNIRQLHTNYLLERRFFL
jgi:hypothetical protein